MAGCDDRNWRSVDSPVSPTVNHGLLANVADDLVSGDVMAPTGAEILANEAERMESEEECRLKGGIESERYELAKEDDVVRKKRS